MLFAPLEGWRHIKVTDRHTAVDYAHLLKDVADIHFSAAQTIVLVQDNLNIHSKASWIPERSATRLREADLNVLSKLGKQGLEWRLESEAFTGREVRREDDLLDFPVGCPVDIEVARQPSA